ncbi:hypothetical protein J6590_001791 [Homalodisca vitripennis]|nr:hypothetical protein J6590_001791 [Homalodisca vitripennis]
MLGCVQSLSLLVITDEHTIRRPGGYSCNQYSPIAVPGGGRVQFKGTASNQLSIITRRIFAPSCFFLSRPETTLRSHGQS